MTSHKEIQRLARLLLEDPGDEGAREHMAHVLERAGADTGPLLRFMRVPHLEDAGQTVLLKERTSYVLETTAYDGAITLKPITHTRKREIVDREGADREPPHVTVTNYGFAVPEDVARRVIEIAESGLRRQPPQPPRPTSRVGRALTRAGGALVDLRDYIRRDDE